MCVVTQIMPNWHNLRCPAAGPAWHGETCRARKVLFTNQRLLSEKPPKVLRLSGVLYASYRCPPAVAACDDLADLVSHRDCRPWPAREARCAHTARGANDGFID